jgi:hypothetical protein
VSYREITDNVRRVFVLLGWTLASTARSFAKRPVRPAAPAGSVVQDIDLRRRHTSNRFSEFGRLPQDTADILANLVSRATGPIAEALPIDASAAMTKDTVAIVLDNLILDWRINNNLSGVDDTDVQDIGCFIAFASTFADKSYSRIGQATYKTVLAFLMRDWLENWNADGISGPPEG